MSLTLKVATATTIVLTKARQLANGVLFQLVGASYAQTVTYRMTQNVGKTGTAKSRGVVTFPYSFVGADGLTRIDAGYAEWGTTVPNTMPVTEALKLPWLLQSSAADQSCTDLVAYRSFTAV